MEYMDFDDLKELADRGESDLAEFTEKLDMKTDQGREKLLSCMVAMANSYGGDFVVGVKQKRGGFEISRTDIDMNSFRDRLDNLVHEFVDPQGVIVYRSYEIAEGKKRCIVVHIEAVPARCYALRTRGRAKRFSPYRLFIRENSRTQEVDIFAFFRVVHLNFLSSFARAVELEEDALKTPFEIIGPPPFDPKRIARNLDLLETLMKKKGNGWETKSKLLGRLRNFLPEVPHGKLSANDRMILDRVLAILKKTIDVDVTREMSLDMISVLSSRGDDEFRGQVKNIFEKTAERIFKTSPVGKEKEYALKIMQNLHLSDKKYLKTLLLEMIEDWSDEEFKALSGRVRLYELDDDTIERMRKEFWLKRLEAEMEGDKGLLERLDYVMESLRL
jgi:hypothetical protein